jgi:hypothetical protein
MSAFIRISIIALLVSCAGCQTIGRDALFRLTLHVVDDAGQPVKDAKARIGADRRPKAGESDGKGNFTEGLTDGKGLFSGELEAWDASQAGYRVEKQDHYGVWLPYYAKSPVRGKWQPWNPIIEVVLKRIKNPVPMYAKLVHGEVPAKGVDVGYDLVVGDWIAPYGRGRIADIVFHGEGVLKDNRNYRGKLTVTFPGQGNGLIQLEVPQPQSSPLRMPYEAPADGYESERVWRAVRKYNPQTMENEEYVNDSSKTGNFFIRVRAELDAEGKIMKALYGKIHAPFEFGPRGKNAMPAIYFVYYLNPDGTRNIEYDPKRNLLKSSKREDPDYENLEP